MAILDQIAKVSLLKYISFYYIINYILYNYELGMFPLPKPATVQNMDRVMRVLKVSVRVFVNRAGLVHNVRTN